MESTTVGSYHSSCCTYGAKGLPQRTPPPPCSCRRPSGPNRKDYMHALSLEDDSDEALRNLSVPSSRHPSSVRSSSAGSAPHVSSPTTGGRRNPPRLSGSRGARTMARPRRCGPRGLAEELSRRAPTSTKETPRNKRRVAADHDGPTRPDERSADQCPRLTDHGTLGASQRSLLSAHLPPPTVRTQALGVRLLW